jgi:NodT family efflux transporter outer membrane factor (OMF) lipoprotein
LGGCASQYEGDLSEQAQKTNAQLEHWSQSQSQAQSYTSLLALLPVPEIDSLIAKALANNPSVQQQILTLKMAKSQRDIAAAARIPQTNASFSGSKTKDTSTLYTSNISVNWEVDLWHKLGDEIDAAYFDIATSQANLQALQNTLAAEVMRTYLEIISYRQLIAIEQDRLSVLKNNEDVILGRYRTGLGDLDDLDSARTSSAATVATIAEYKENLAIAYRELSVLLGEQQVLPDTAMADVFPEVGLPLPSLPEQDLGNRPDLQAAYFAIEADESRVKVAYKELLPSLDLTAALYQSASSPSSSFFTDPVWNLLGQITAPIFQGGQLQANIDVSEYTALYSYWDYQSTLLTAVQEVEDALGQEQSLQAQITAIDVAYVNAQRSATNYTDKYRQGLVDILDLLTVYEQTYDLKVQKVQLQFNQLSNRIDLGLALGLGVNS